VVWSGRCSCFSSGRPFFDFCHCLVRHSASAFRFRPFELFQSALGRTLLPPLFSCCFACRHALPVNPDFDLENLLVVGAALSGNAIFRRRPPLPLQEFLQCGFAIGLEMRSPRSSSACSNRTFRKHLARSTQSAIEVNRSHYCFERICPAAFAYPARRFSLPAFPTSSALPSTAVVQPSPGNQHLRSAHGLGKLPFAHSGKVARRYSS